MRRGLGSLILCTAFAFGCTRGGRAVGATEPVSVAIVGCVTDSTGAVPLDQLNVISPEAGDRAVTDTTGFFVLRTILARGANAVRFQRIGYDTIVAVRVASSPVIK